MQIVIFEKLFRAAFVGEVVFVSVGVVDKGNVYFLVGLELLGLVEEEFKGNCVGNDFADLVGVLEGG